MAGLNKYQAYPEYRDSGVEWLGEIPRTWQAYTGKRLFSSVRTPALSNDEQLAASQKYGVIPQTLMMQLNDSKVMLALKGTDSFRHVEKNNFVISLRSFEGGIEHSNYQGCVSPAYTVLKSVNDISFSFYRYLLKSEPYISALQASTDSLRDGKSINYEQFGAITLPSPSLPEQSIIAHFLDHETAKIDNLIEKQQLIELLKEKRQAVISHAVTKGLNPDVPMKDSGVEWLDEIPEHWRICKLKNLAKICNGQDYKLVQAETGYPVIGSGGQFAWANTFLYDKPSVLLGRKGTIDKPLYIDKAFWTVDTMYYTEVFDCIIEKYLYYLALTIQFNRYATNTALPSMTQEHLGNYSFSLSFNLSEQKLIINSIEKSLIKIDALTEKQLKQIELLKERRTALISAAVTGKIDLRNWTAPIAKTEAPTEASA
ncbi:restriction endonuclease subunit S [Escherichia coli]|uniref:restriction endonuclease subunit S n=1 Tax=Escherichia coli TaxID=562 RepID=UPI0006A523B1|nr:restriction endonuclease subunit S [Escherichia coli]HDQ6499315.1 restriction endonuclease subunit S [Escherichia coli Ou:H6]EFC7678642.1 restriction endonuclease subunit S [Escherichia coli]EFG1601566.1 restriction endonuclease subunit S [Escherichia coli]EGD7792188.1 restriction endonuclease subunit S [Escherichia coli]EGM7808157.1 restriction endonuclease subunit S [Escherichia coli]